MKSKIPKKELKEKAESIKNIVDDIINERIDVPDNALVIDFDATLNIFTKKRIELLDLINLYEPMSVQELSDISNRTKQAVDRDLKLLEQFDVIKLEKRGKFTIPIVKREIVVLNLKKPKQPNKQEMIVAEVYVNNFHINEIVGVPL